MSHAIGMVRFNDGAIIWFEYNGSCDYSIPKLYNTLEEMKGNWRKWKWENHECEHMSEPIQIFTNYGYGFFWNAAACRKCGMILDGQEPSIDHIDGIPEWADQEHIRLYGKGFGDFRRQPV